MIQSPIIDSMEEAPVDILIEAENRRWNIDLVDGLFAPRNLKLSNKFPLAHFEYEDALYWPLSQDGGYTCKLGYRF